MALGYMPAQTVYVAAELGIADLLAGGPRPADDLAEATGTHPPSLLRLLRALTALGILTQAERPPGSDSEPGSGPDPDPRAAAGAAAAGGGTERFGLAELGQQLRSDVPDSLRDFIRVVCQREFWVPWGDLVESIRTGEPAFDRVVGVPVFEYLARHPDKAAVFNAGMSNVTRQVAPAIAAGYDFARFRTIVDVGGGNGSLLAEVLRSAPDARGVLFDLPAGLDAAPPVLDAAGVADRCQVVAGDFFAGVPQDADAYMMKSVIHDWDDDRAVTILRNCRDAMAPGGRVLVIERTVPERVTPGTAELLMIDLNMLVSATGRERTEADYRELLTAAGLTLVAVSEPLGELADRVIEAAAEAG